MAFHVAPTTRRYVRFTRSGAIWYLHCSIFLGACGAKLSSASGEGMYTRS